MECIIPVGLVGVVILLRKHGVDWMMVVGTAMILRLLVHLPIFLSGRRDWNIPADVGIIVLTG